MENLANKSVSELNETKTTGKYCDKEYTLEGDWCYKEIDRTSASDGEVCPLGYLEYDGKCYEEAPIEETNTFVCHDDFYLEEDKCVRIETINAEASRFACSQGEAKTKVSLGLTDQTNGDANDIVCVDYSEATHPVSPCELNDGTEYTMSGGKCYWHRAPVIASGCPGKIQIGDFCWDDASNIYICAGYRDGKQYSNRNEYCENSVKYFEPIVSEYKCPNGYTLSGNQCVKEEKQEAMHERKCPNEYTLVNNDRCINYNKMANKENGLVCEGDNSRLKGNMCIIYEVVHAEHN